MRWIGIAALAAFQLGAVAAVAPEPCTSFYNESIKGQDVPAESVYAVLNTQRQRGCILGASDTTGIERQYQLLFQESLSATDTAVARAQLLQSMIGEFDGVANRICAGFALDCVAGRHLESLRMLARGIESGAFEPLAEQMQSNQWVPKEADGEVRISSINLLGFLSVRCAPGTDEPECGSAVEVAAKVMRTGLAANQLIVSHRRPIIGVNSAFLSGRDREWEAYLNGASVQYPWELAVNSWRFDWSAADRDRFPRAPRDQFVLLHPSPAVEYIDTPSGNATTQAAIVIELVGYQRWQWRDGKQRNRWGLSAIASLADAPGMDPLGFGAMVHTPFKNAALGVVWRDGDDGREIGVVLNLDLAGLVKQYKNDDLASFLGR